MMNFRTTASAALLAVLGTMFATVPASAAPTPPAVRLSGELVQVADQQGPGFAAIRLADNALVPIDAQSVKDIATGSAVTLDVAIPADVRVAAAANRTLTTRGVDGKQIAVRLRSSDLAAASDGSPESLTSTIGKATVAEAMAPGTPALEVSKIVAAAADPISTFTPATREVYVASVTPAGATPQPTVDQSPIRAQVDGASSYWSDVTGGALTLSVTTIAAQYTSAYNCSDPFGMWNEAADKVGFTSAPNTSLVLELPKTAMASCGYGRGTIGDSPNDSGFLYVADVVWPVLAHELGHNMSLQHANALLCPTAPDSAYSTTTSAWTGTDCEEASYGDGQDVMSASRTDFAPFLSAPQSLRTGIIAPSAARVIDTAGTQSVTLLPLAGRAGVRAAEVVNPTTGVTYYVEYRTPVGRDLQNVYDGVKTGVRVLRYNPDTGATLLLDPSPSSQIHDPDPTLPVGKTFTSYDGAVSITTLSADRVNAVVSINNGASPVTAPGAPTAVAATAGDSSAAVSWDAPTSNGGAPITGYTVTAAPGGRTATTTGTIATVTGLTNGTAHTFTVTATNTAGTSTASTASGAVTPVHGSSADTTMPMLSSYSVTGSPATPGGTITMSYAVTEAAGSLQTVIFNYVDPLGGTRQISSAGTVPLTGTITKVIPATWPNGTYTLNDITLVDPSGNQVRYMAGGTIYKFPTGAAGPTSHSFNLNTANFTVAEVPSAPSWVSVSGGNQKANLVWSPASSNGLPITGYTVTASPGGKTVTTAGATAATVTELTNGTSYTFTVTATNGIGTSQASTPSTPVIPSPVAPSQPTAVTATAGDAAGLVSWTAPVSNGGSAVSGYTVTASPGGKTATTTGATSATVTGLTNGTVYTFTVTATNTAGDSAASLPSAAVTPKSTMISGSFTPLPTARVFDATVTTAPRQVQIAGLGGVPADATAVMVNTEVFAPTAAGYVRVTPAGLNPGVAVQEFAKGQAISNLVAVKLVGGKIQVKVSAGSARILMDVSGYYSARAGGSFTPLATARVFDGKATTTTRQVQIAGLGGVPADATAVMVNTEVFAPTAAGYVRVTPAGLDAGVAVQEFAKGQAISNLVAVKLVGGKIQVKVSAGSARILIDVAGYYSAGARS
jgi:Fibronectin type III domain